MKKRLFSALMAVMLIFVAACSGAGADSIAKKIDNHEKLSQEDYSVMISYVKEAFTDLTSLSEKYASNPQ